MGLLFIYFGIIYIPNSFSNDKPCPPCLWDYFYKRLIVSVIFKTKTLNLKIFWKWAVSYQLLKYEDLQLFFVIFFAIWDSKSNIFSLLLLVTNFFYIL